MNTTNIKEVTTKELVIETTKLANQRTYLAYMRTGFAISAIAGVSQKKWIFIFGVCMIILSSIQYVSFNNKVTNKLNPYNHLADMIPLLYIIIALGTLYLEFIKKYEK